MVDTPPPELQRISRAVVVVDVVESVRLMQQHPEQVIARWRQLVADARAELLPQHGGRMVKSLGDGMLLEFGSVRDGLACARALLGRMAHVNQSVARLEPLMLRVGLHFADIVADDTDIYGPAVNLAARIAGLAAPGQIVASIEAVDQIVDDIDAQFEDMGECFLKHLPRPVRAYRLLPAGQPALHTPGLANLLMPDAAADLPRPRLAVFNLETLDLAPALGSLVSDEMAVQLSAHTTVDVISRMSLRHALGADPAVLLQRLNAHYALSGSCSDLGSEMLVTLELAFVPGHRVVWSRTFRTSLAALVADPAGGLAELCRSLLESIQVHETGRARSLPLASLDSYSLMLGGLRLMHRLSRSDFERSHEVFEALVARHPRHPDGYAWLAKWHILQLHQGWADDPQRSADMARDMARRALDRDDRCGVAMVVSGMVRAFSERRLDAAERIYAEALESNPNEALAWLLKGMVHAFRGEGEQAVAHARRARELSPLDPMRYYFDSLGASAEASAGHYELAVQLAQRSLQANSMHASTLRILTIAYAMLDRIDEARGVVHRIQALEPDFTVSRFLARSPSSDFPIGQTFARALARAGVPP